MGPPPVSWDTEHLPDGVLSAVKPLGAGRVCVLATGKTAKARSPLWKGSLDRVIPLVGELDEALRCVSRPREEPS